MGTSLVVAGLGLVIGLGLGFFFRRKRGRFAPASKSSAADVRSTVKEILPIAEFACLVYHYSAVISHSQAAKFFRSEISIPLTGKKAIYTIDGTIKLGFDGGKVKVENSYNNVIISLPPMRILSHEVYPETFSLYDEQTSLFSHYSLKDANAIQALQKTTQEDKVKADDGLFVQARQSSEKLLRSLLETIPAIKGKYEIVFRWAESE